MSKIKLNIKENVRHNSILKKTASRICSTQVLYGASFVESEIDLLIKSYLRHPLMTFKIIAAIHFEAFKLWTKGIRFVQKKLKIRNNISFEN